MRRQLVGAYDHAAAGLMAEVFAGMGAERVYVVHSEDGLDEISLSGRTSVQEIDHERPVASYEIDSGTLGLPCTSADSLRGGSPQENARTILAILGREKGPRARRDRRQCRLRDHGVGQMRRSGARRGHGRGIDRFRPGDGQIELPGGFQQRVNNQTDILTRIVEAKRQEVAAARMRTSARELLARPGADRPRRSLVAALSGKPMAIIAEMKRSSPSAGRLKADLSPALVAAAYERNGAAAISVLTDCRFGGCLDDLAQAGSAVKIPVLRKDFIIDEFQLAEASAYGADAVLLIAAILDRGRLSDLYASAAGMGLECLVELHDVDEIDKIDFDRMRLVGVNNRDLRTLQTNIEQTLRVYPRIPAGVTVVSESGIRSASDLRALAGQGIRAALIGEQFMRAEEPALALRELLDRFAVAQSGGPNP